MKVKLLWFVYSIFSMLGNKCAKICLWCAEKLECDCDKKGMVQFYKNFIKAWADQ